LNNKGILPYSKEAQNTCAGLYKEVWYRSHWNSGIIYFFCV